MQEYLRDNSFLRSEFPTRLIDQDLQTDIIFQVKQSLSENSFESFAKNLKSTFELILTCICEGSSDVTTMGKVMRDIVVGEIRQVLREYDEEADDSNLANIVRSIIQNLNAIENGEAEVPFF